MSLEFLNGGTHGSYFLPAGMELSLAPFGPMSSARATSSVSGLGTWTTTGSALQIGPFDVDTEIVVEVLSGDAGVEIDFPNGGLGSSTLVGLTDYHLATIDVDNTPLKNNLASKAAAIQAAADAAAQAATSATNALAAAASALTAASGASTSAAAAVAAVSNKVSRFQDWDAFNNIPHLSSGVDPGVNNCYRVTVAGTTNLDGENAWPIGALALFGPSTWTKIADQSTLGNASDLDSVDLPNLNNPLHTALANLSPTAKATSFSTTWDMSSTKDMGDYTITAALALVSSNTGSTPGGYTQATLIADGSHTPTFDGSTLSTWTNTSGTHNRIKLERVGASKYWMCGSVAGVAIVGGGGTPTIGGIALGTAGTGNNAGYVLSDGLEGSALLDIVSPANPLGAFFTSRGGYATTGGASAGAGRTPTGALGTAVDTSPEYTGPNDSNRGAPITWDGLTNATTGIAQPPHSIQTVGGVTALRLVSGPQSAAEATKLFTGESARVNRVAMVDSIGRFEMHAPGIVEINLRMPQGPAGQHPTAWMLSGNPAQTTTGNEYGLESNGCSNSATAASNLYHDDHVPGGGSVTGTNTNLGQTYRDNNFHTLKLVLTTTTYQWFMDDVSLASAALRTLSATAGSVGSPSARGDQPDRLILTNHAYTPSFPTTAGESLSASAWLAANLPHGIEMDIAWVRFWRSSSGSHYVPQGSYLTSGVGDILVTSGGAINATLPTATALWGSNLTDYLQALQNENEEPGGTDTYTNGLPSWLSWNGTTRALTGTAPARSGALHMKLGMAAGSTTAGSTARPARFRICVAPIYTGSTTVPFTNGTVGSNFDLYAAWDCGRLFIGTSGGTAGKGLTASGLPTGMTLGSNGIISGTPTVNGSYTVTTTATNSVGQTSTQNITMTVAAASTAVAAPAGITSATLVGSWDFNAGTSTISSGKITNITGSDGTSFALANATAGPVQTTDVDGNGTTRTVAQFVAANAAFLQIASSLGISTTASLTFVLVARMNRAGGNSLGTAMGLMEVSNGGAVFGQSRHVLLASASTTGFNFRKIDSTATSSSCLQGTAYSATGVHCLIGRSLVGAAATPILNIGGGTNIVGASNGQATGLNAFTLGATREANAQTKFADANYFRALVYSGALSDADQAAVYAWAQTNFGVVTA